MVINRFPTPAVPKHALTHHTPHRLTMIGSVLALRGAAVTRQPLVDDHSNVLLFNGEVFGGIHVSLSPKELN